jgi:hypothetical protein
LGSDVYTALLEGAADGTAGLNRTGMLTADSRLVALRSVKKCTNVWGEMIAEFEFSETIGTDEFALGTCSSVA